MFNPHTNAKLFLHMEDMAGAIIGPFDDFQQVTDHLQFLAERKDSAALMGVYREGTQAYDAVVANWKTMGAYRITPEKDRKRIANRECRLTNNKTARPYHMNKPNVTIALVRKILKFGRFETDLAAVDKGNERYGRRGYTDKRVNGKRIKLTAWLSPVACQYVQDALNELFDVRATVREFGWVMHARNCAKYVTVIHVEQ